MVEKLQKQMYMLSEECKKEKEYWINKLSGELNVNNFPYDNIANADSIISKVKFVFPTEITNKLLSISKTSDKSLFCILLSVVKVLLYKYTNTTESIVGTTVYRQENGDALINSILVLRSIMEDSKSFKEFLLGIKNIIKEAETNQNIPLDILVENEISTSALNISDIFRTGVILENIHEESYFQDIKPKILFKFKSYDNEISCEVNYCANFYLESTIHRIIGHLIHILGIVLNNINIKLEDIELVTEEEKLQILMSFCNRAEYPKNKTIHQLFEEQVNRTPDNIAVVYNDESLTYRELNEKSNQLARLLIHKGLKGNKVKEDNIIGIMLERSKEMIIGILAILKAGGAYLPIDPMYPEDRVKFMLEDSQAKILLIKDLDNKPETIEHTTEKLITINLNDENILTGDSTNLDTVSDADNSLAYIIYTSGTTGKPKGAMIEHRNVVSLMLNDKIQFDFTDKDVWTMFHSMSFDFSVWEMYGALLYGGRLVIVPKAVAQDPSEFVKLLKKENVTILNQTPTAFYNIISKEVENENKELKIRYVVFGGEALKPSILKNWREKYPNAKLINMYGITETTVHVTYKAITEIEIEANISNIGKPISTLSTYIMDKNMKLLPVGVSGELYVGGAGVCRGYLGMDELSKEKFIENPYRAGEKLYKSGDLARLLPNGEMEYLGRMDHQVKIRGHRIELGEIESRLLEHKEINEAVVVVKQDIDEGKYLCAYLVSLEQITVKEIRQYLSKQLPAYMIPEHFIQLDKMPMTSNGKIDKIFLANDSKYSISDLSVIIGEKYEAPRNEIEEKLEEIWKEILKVDKIGINVSFFELGGHSIKAASLAAKIHKQFNKEMAVKQILKAPTIREMAEYIKGLEDSEYLDIEKVKESKHYEMSFGQKRLWLISQFEPNSTAYNMPSIIDINEELDFDCLNKTIKELTNRHESLKTSFVTIAGNPVQIINEIHEVPIKVYDISNLLEKEKEEKLKSIYTTEFNYVFNLESILFKASIVKTEHERYKILILIHHIITDGWSMNILERDFKLIYDSIKKKQQISISPIKLQYKDYANWQNKMIDNNSKVKKIKEYWIEQSIGEAKELKWPAKVINHCVSMGVSKNLGIRFFINKSITEKIKKLSVKKNKSIYTLLITSLNVYLYALTGQKDILIASAGSGRQHVDLNDMVGYFINTLIIKTKINEESFESLLNRINNNILQVLDYQYYPIELLLDEQRIRYPKINVFFNMLNIYDTNNELKDFTTKYTTELHDAKFDLTFYAVEYKNGIELNVNYRNDKFNVDTVENIIKEYVNTIEYYVDNPTASVSI